MESELLGSELVLDFASCEVDNVYNDHNDANVTSNTDSRHEEQLIKANNDDDDDDTQKVADTLMDEKTEGQEVISTRVSSITTKNREASELDLNKIKSKSDAKKLGKTLYKEWKKLKRESKEKRKTLSVKHNGKHKRHRNEDSNVDDDDEDDNGGHENTLVDERETKDESKRHRHHKHHHHRTRHDNSDKHKRHHRHRRKHSDKTKHDRDNEDEEEDNDDDNDDGNNIGNNTTSVITSSEFANFTVAEREAAEHKARRREELLRQASSLNAAKTLTPRQATAKVHEMAKNLVESMRNARAKDDLILARNARLEKNKDKKVDNNFSGSNFNGSNDNSKDFNNLSGFSPSTQALPLNKIALKATVESQCQRSFLIGPLIEAGILQELSYWLYDFDRNEPAAYELRTTALDILLRFPIEGELENVPGRRSRNGDEDLTIFTGMDREHFIHTNIGRAVNALRLHSNEIAENRSKCVQLLERLSRAMSGGVRASTDMFDRSVDLQDGGARLGNRPGAHGAGQSVQAAATTLLWEQKGIRGIASPFNIVQTSSESFQKAFAKPDLRDPTSYHNLLLWREPVRAITNLSGRLAHQIVQPEMPKESGLHKLVIITE